MSLTSQGCFWPLQSTANAVPSNMRPHECLGDLACMHAEAEPGAQPQPGGHPACGLVLAVEAAGGCDTVALLCRCDSCVSATVVATHLQGFWSSAQAVGMYHESPGSAQKKERKKGPHEPEPLSFASEAV